MTLYAWGGGFYMYQCSYAGINGTASCENGHLLKTWVRLANEPLSTVRPWYWRIVRWPETNREGFSIPPSPKFRDHVGTGIGRVCWQRG